MSVDLVDGRMIDQALSQTYIAGCRYAIVPYPWWEEWLRWLGDNRAVMFPWWKTCGLPGHDFSKVVMDNGIDDDGNITWCLLEEDHDGECGGP